MFYNHLNHILLLLLLLCILLLIHLNATVVVAVVIIIIAVVVFAVMIITTIKGRRRRRGAHAAILSIIQHTIRPINYSITYNHCRRRQWRWWMGSRVANISILTSASLLLLLMMPFIINLANLLLSLLWKRNLMILTHTIPRSILPTGGGSILLPVISIICADPSSSLLPRLLISVFLVHSCVRSTRRHARTLLLLLLLLLVIRSCRRR